MKTEPKMPGSLLIVDDSAPMRETLREIMRPLFDVVHECVTGEDAAAVDWGTLILFGGGIALSDALFKTGLAPWIASAVISAIGSPSTFLLVLVIVVFVDFLTEVTSNTAVTSMITPVVVSIALAIGADPAALAVAAAIAASLAFMLPVATPPNALVYGTGYVSLRAMVRNGFILDILGWVMVISLLPLFGGLIFGLLRF